MIKEIYNGNVYWTKKGALEVLQRSRKELKEELLKDRDAGVEIWTLYQEENWDFPTVSKYMDRYQARQSIKSSIFYVDELLEMLE